MILPAIRLARGFGFPDVLMPTPAGPSSHTVERDSNQEPRSLPPQNDSDPDAEGVRLPLPWAPQEFRSYCNEYHIPEHKDIRLWGYVM